MVLYDGIGGKIIGVMREGKYGEDDMKMFQMKTPDGGMMDVPDYGIRPREIAFRGDEKLPYVVYDKITFYDTPSVQWNIQYDQNGVIFDLIKVELKKYTERGFSRYILTWSGECEKCLKTFYPQSSKKRASLPVQCEDCISASYALPPENEALEKKRKREMEEDKLPFDVWERLTFEKINPVLIKDDPIHTVPPVGSVIGATKTFHELIYTEEEGADKVLYWLSRCLECGAPFVQITGTEKMRINARCPKHAKWGKPIEHGRHVPKNTDYQ